MIEKRKGRGVKRNTQVLINDIEHCLAEAQRLTDPHIRQPLRQAFRHLAGDETTGLVAYAVWRGRSRMLSLLNRVPGYLQPGANTSRASRT